MSFTLYKTKNNDRFAFYFEGGLTSCTDSLPEALAEAADIGAIKIVELPANRFWADGMPEALMNETDVLDANRAALETAKSQLTGLNEQVAKVQAEINRLEQLT